MNNPWEWDENDLLALVIAQTQENIELDFKESASLQNTDKKKDEISKDVSAFANSAGGTLIYGMKEDTSTHVVTGLDAGSDPTVITKEWLEQVINSRIHQRIDGVRIHQVPLTTTSLGRVTYVVYTPASSRAPHQASDKRFYKRFNFQSIPMEEYEIRDISHRSVVPDLRIEFTLPNNKLTFNQGDTFSVPFPLNATITNDAVEPADYAVIALYIDARIAIQNAQELSVTRDAILSIEDTQLSISVLRLNWGVPTKMPLFLHAQFTITSNPLLLRSPSNGTEEHKCYVLGYEIKSPRMPVKRSIAFLHVHPDSTMHIQNYLSTEEVLANYSALQQ